MGLALSIILLVSLNSSWRLWAVSIKHSILIQFIGGDGLDPVTKFDGLWSEAGKMAAYHFIIFFIVASKEGLNIKCSKTNHSLPCQLWGKSFSKILNSQKDRDKVPQGKVFTRQFHKFPTFLPSVRWRLRHRACAAFSFFSLRKALAKWFFMVVLRGIKPSLEGALHRLATVKPWATWQKGKDRLESTHST